MTASNERKNLYGLSRIELVELFSELGEKPFRAQQLMDLLYRQDSLDPSQWTTFSLSLRKELSRQFEAHRPSIAQRQVSDDGSLKVVLDLADGKQVEAVAMPTDERMTFCISSQAGCAFGCTFCMTGKLGFLRQLQVGEIVGQVAALMEETGTDHQRYNIVFMGMGEPLHNLENVLGATRLLTEEKAFGLGPRRITVSTVGLPAGIDRLAEEEIPPRLAVSIVCADAQVRESLMPAARRYSLEDLARAIRDFGRGKRDRPTLEVVLLKGINDLPEHAEQLATFARKAAAKVNLIEFNPTPELDYLPSPEPRIQHFLRVLTRAGVWGTVRRSRGKDIDGACGQLALKNR